MFAKNAATEKQLVEYKQSEQGLQKEIARLKQELEAAKPKNKEAVQSNIDRKEEELRLVVEEKGRLENNWNKTKNRSWLWRNKLLICKM